MDLSVSSDSFEMSNVSGFVPPASVFGGRVRRGEVGGRGGRRGGRVREGENEESAHKNRLES